MKILFCGDVVGSAGRKAIEKYLPDLKKDLSIDVVIINAENAAHGFGLTPKMVDAFKKFGADILTMGNHTFDKKDIFESLDKDPSIIRPLNYPDGTIGRGFGIFDTPKGKIAVIQLLGRLFMKPNEHPFEALDKALASCQLGKDVNAIIVDMHAEATSEKMATGFFADGRVSAVLGTHTHIPTADCMILPNGTGYMTDVGMCGDYYSVIGMTTQSALPRFTSEKKEANSRLEPAEKDGTLCGVYIETDDNTGKCTHIRPIRLGAHLIETK